MKMVVSCKRLAVLVIFPVFLAIQEGCRPVPEKQQELEHYQLLSHIARASDQLDPATIKAILRRNEPVEQRIRTLEDAIAARPNALFTCDPLREDLLMEIIGDDVHSEAPIKIRVQSWLDEYQRGEIGERGDIEGFKVITDKVDLRPGQRRQYILNPHLQKRGMHILFVEFHQTSKAQQYRGRLTIRSRALDGSSDRVLFEIPIQFESEEFPVVITIPFSS
jgi:hypothetical protein